MESSWAVNSGAYWRQLALGKRPTGLAFLKARVAGENIPAKQLLVFFKRFLTIRSSKEISCTCPQYLFGFYSANRYLKFCSLAGFAQLPPHGTVGSSKLANALHTARRTQACSKKGGPKLAVRISSLDFTPCSATLNVTPILTQTATFPNVVQCTGIFFLHLCRRSGLSSSKL